MKPLAEQLELHVARKRVRRSHRVGDTSLHAGDRASSHTEVLRDRLVAAIRAAGDRGLTADEAAAQVGENADLKAVMNVRRRISDLAKALRIIDTPDRRENADGNSQIVWRVAGGPSDG